MPLPEPIEPPEGFQTSHESVPTPGEAERPDWLVGADEGLAAEEDPERQQRTAGEKPVLRRVGQPDVIVNQGAPAAPKVEPPTPWVAAAPSVPKLAIVPRREPPPQARPMPDEEQPTISTPEEGLDTEVPIDAAEVLPPIRPHDEPLWLVWTEALATNRKLQVAILAALVALAAYAFWPREEGRSVPLGQIRKHPDRFEGHTVKVRGQVGEVFDIGRGYVFNLIQGRDTVVVFSPTRHPEPHDKIRVDGTVSTGYLDGMARVAIFETPGTSSAR
jgi:hypothetical protein